MRASIAGFMRYFDVLKKDSAEVPKFQMFYDVLFLEQREYREEVVLKDCKLKEEARVLEDTENWILDFLQGKTEGMLERFKSLEKDLKVIYQKQRAFFFKNHAANDWWMLEAFGHDLPKDVLSFTTKAPMILSTDGKLRFLIQKLKHPGELSYDLQAYYLSSVCSVFAIYWAEKLGCMERNLEVQNVIHWVESKKVMPLADIEIWRRMNYDRNQIAHDYDPMFNQSIKENLGKYITFIERYLK